MIYLDNGATSFPKPLAVRRAVQEALETCANPGRGGYEGAMAASRTIYACREQAGNLFSCAPEQVVLTTSCTHGLNIAIASLVKPGTKVVISGFEHNAVTRPLHALGAKIQVAGRKLFDWENTLSEFRKALEMGAQVAVFTQVSNVFGYALPMEELAALCRQAGIPFVVDAAQGAGTRDLDFSALGADFVAMPGHKGLLGPQGTGLLLCKAGAEPLLYGGTGSNSASWEMPDFLPDRLEPGTLNVPGFAGLTAGMKLVQQIGPQRLGEMEAKQAAICARGLEEMGMQVFCGPIRRAPFPSCRTWMWKKRRPGWAARGSPCGRDFTALQWPTKAPVPWKPARFASASGMKLPGGKPRPFCGLHPNYPPGKLEILAQWLLPSAAESAIMVRIIGTVYDSLVYPEKQLT